MFLVQPHKHGALSLKNVFLKKCKKVKFSFGICVEAFIELFASLPQRSLENNFRFQFFSSFH